MPHIITGEIRKDVYIKDGQGQKGPYRLYVVEISESYKNRDGNREYTNYRAPIFASEAMQQWLDHSLVKGNVISLQCDRLKVDMREHNGNTYTTLEMLQPKILFLGSITGQQGASGQQQAQRQATQQQAPRQAPQQQSPSPQQDFDDDIPF